jgi:hypothetical protein
MFAPKDTTLEPGAYLQATRPINRSTRYEIVSVPGYQDPMLRKEQRAAALRVPKNLPPEAKKLAESWKAVGNDAAILAHGMQWFEAQDSRTACPRNAIRGRGPWMTFSSTAGPGFVPITLPHLQRSCGLRGCLLE